MARRLAPLLVGVVLVLSGCSRHEPTPPSGFLTGTSLHTINVGGRDRTYRLYKPAGLPASAPLVVMLHGAFATAEQAERSYGWDQLADSAQVRRRLSGRHRQGLERHGGGCCGKALRENIDDVGFITAMVGQTAAACRSTSRASMPPGSATAAS